MREKSYKIALGGVLSAVAVAVMFLGGIIPFTTYVSPVLASLCVMIIHIELGTRQSLLMYFAVAFLALILSPDKEASLIFAVFFGYYPIIRQYLEKFSPVFLKFTAKLLLFNFSVTGLYFVVTFIFTVPAIAADFEEMTSLMIILLVVAGNITFLLYDKMITRTQLLYINRIRPGLIKEK